MSTRMNAMIGLGIAVAIAATPFVYWSRESVRYRNFRVVEDGVLLRSGQMTPDGFARLTREFGVRTVISLRDRRDDTGLHEDHSEAEICRAAGIAFHRLPPADWERVNGISAGDRNIAEFVRILDDPKTERPVLIHCFAGIHRTGVHCAIFRKEYHGWSSDEALAELQSKGTRRTTYADSLLNFVRDYTPRRDRPTVGVSPANR